MQAFFCMAFRLPPHLLEQLRERRASQRREPTTDTPTRKRSLLDATKALFVSQKPDLALAAAQFVDTMDKLQVEVEDQHDAFLLDPGMGPMTYLTSDGRVLLDFRTWDGAELREASSLDEEITSVVVGAKKTGIAALLSLLPDAPPEGVNCPKCDGKRLCEIVPGDEFRQICILCNGRGWATPSMVAAARERGVTWS